jgi:hypothetical protein
MEALLKNPVAVAVITALAMWIIGWIRTFLARRVHVESPEAKTLAQVVPAVNAILCVMGPLLDASIANLEVAKGICNGNVDRALTNTRAAQIKFDAFLNDSAKVEAVE